MDSPILNLRLSILATAAAALIIAAGCSPNGSRSWAGFGLSRSKSKNIFSDSENLIAKNAPPQHSKSTQEPDTNDENNGVALVSYSQSGSETWIESLDQARKLSAETGKPILADFTGSDWCGYCVKLKDEVFASPQFQIWAADNVVLLEIDYPKRSSQASWLREQNEALKKRYSISQFPTVLLLTAEGRTIGKLGYMNDADKWIAVANNAIRADESITRLDREASSSNSTTR
jgi:protein disulfide-isomerase